MNRSGLSQNSFLQGETGSARVRVDSWRSDLTAEEDQEAVERLLKNILIW
jgi:hypothetical protein